MSDGLIILGKIVKIDLNVSDTLCLVCRCAGDTLGRISQNSKSIKGDMSTFTQKIKDMANCLTQFATILDDLSECKQVQHFLSLQVGRKYENKDTTVVASTLTQ